MSLFTEAKSLGLHEVVERVKIHAAGWLSHRNVLRVDSAASTWWYGSLVATFKVSRESVDGIVVGSSSP